MTFYHQLFARAETTAAETYFAGGNSPEGYKPLPGGVFREAEFQKLYILKGGPGTGKSTLIAEVGRRAAARGASASFYCCGSDPSSFDGIVLTHGKTRIGILDGTPPHAQEPLYPGISGEYVNLGAFWDSAMLEARRGEALALASEKAQHFADAWRALGASDLVDRSLEAIVRDAVKTEKMEAAAARLLGTIRPAAKRAGTGAILVHGVTMQGAVALPTLEKTTARRIRVLEEGDASRFYLAALCRVAARSGFYAETALSPVRHELALGVRLPAEGVSFTVTNEKAEDGETVNMERFLDPAVWRATRHARRARTKQREDLFRTAEASFRAAGEVHFALEKLYGECMDFDGLRAMRDTLADSICARLFP